MKNAGKFQKICTPWKGVDRSGQALGQWVVQWSSWRMAFICSFYVFFLKILK